MRTRFPVRLAVLILAVACSGTVMAGSSPDIQLTIKNQAFSPDTLTIPADTRVRIMVKNADSLPAEFESYDLNREKVVPGGSTVPVYVGPLDPGRYGFFNDFHPSSKGHLIVKPAGQKE